MARNRRYYNKSYNSGKYFADKHVQEAKVLSELLGGTDEDVKSYFFNLDERTLNVILEEYGEENGLEKKRYAITAYPKWKSGKLRMSGLVAGRLYKLLPHHMPLEKKYSLIKTLWEKYCPTSETELTIGKNVDSKEIVDKYKEKLNAVVREYNVPIPLENRFKWLAEGDSTVYQQILNHFLNEDKKLTEKAVESSIPHFLREINKEDSLNKHFSQSFNIGNHKITLYYNPNVDGIIDGKLYSSSGNESNLGCIIIIIIIIVIIVLVNINK